MSGLTSDINSVLSKDVILNDKFIDEREHYNSEVAKILQGAQTTSVADENSVGMYHTNQTSQQYNTNLHPISEMSGLQDGGYEAECLKSDPIEDLDVYNQYTDPEESARSLYR